MSVIESIPNPELKDAGSLYDNGPPILVGNFTLARESARALPINLTEIMEPAIDTLKADPAKALQFAKRFGKLSVNVALDLAATTFTLDSDDAYASPNCAPINTLERYIPQDLFRAEERDAPYAYLLFDEKPMTAEMGIIQALHMLDYALVSNQFDGDLPLFRAVGYEQLAELQAKYQDVYVRTYGNVRGIQNAPEILGTVIPTAILEDSGLQLLGFEAKSSEGLRAVELPVEREKATVIGITTAKRPHIGHGFLLTKAIAQADQYGQVVVELNDLGPRVASAVTALAIEMGITTEQAAEAIMHAEVTPSALEEAYRKRGTFEEAELPSNFALTANNAVYDRLLAQFAPESITVSSLPNSSREMDRLYSSLYNNPLAQPLFGNKDMVLLGDEKATVVAQYGKPTMAGIIGALATGYDLTTVDSPAVLDKNQLKIFERASIPVSQVEGMGLSIGFGVASGTGGEAPSLQKFLASLGPESIGRAPLVLRAVLDEAVFIRGDGSSLNPNYASAGVLLDKLDIASRKDLSSTDIFKPFQFQNITRDLAKSLTPYGIDGLAEKGRVTQIEVLKLMTAFPSLGQYLTPGLLEYCSSSTDVVPRNRISQEDTGLINKIRSGNTPTIFRLVAESLGVDQAYASILRGTMLNEVMDKMGYDIDSVPLFVKLLIQTGDVYVLK